jgi:hypothetical protein
MTSEKRILRDIFRSGGYLDQLDGLRYRKGRSGDSGPAGR